MINVIEESQNVWFKLGFAVIHKNHRIAWVRRGI